LPIPGAAGPHPVLPYLRSPAGANRALDLELEVAIRPAGWPAEAVMTAGNSKLLYWSLAQMVAHHSVGGCALQAGRIYKYRYVHSIDISLLLAPPILRTYINIDMYIV